MRHAILDWTGWEGSTGKQMKYIDAAGRLCSCKFSSMQDPYFSFMGQSCVSQNPKWKNIDNVPSFFNCFALYGVVEALKHVHSGSKKVFMLVGYNPANIDSYKHN